jgi:hypothetical protein
MIWNFSSSALDRSQNKMAIFSKTALTIFINSVIYGEHFPKQSFIGGVCRMVTVRALGTEARNVEFVETCITRLISSLFRIQQQRIIYRATTDTLSKIM